MAKPTHPSRCEKAGQGDLERIRAAARNIDWAAAIDIPRQPTRRRLHVRHRVGNRRTSDRTGYLAGISRGACVERIVGVGDRQPIPARNWGKCPRAARRAGRRPLHRFQPTRSGRRIDRMPDLSDLGVLADRRCPMKPRRQDLYRLEWRLYSLCLAALYLLGRA